MLALLQGLQEAVALGEDLAAALQKIPLTSGPSDDGAVAEVVCV